MKKVLFSIITILLLGLSINPVLGASKVTKDDTGASSWQANSTTETNLYGMTHSFIEGTASTSGANYNQQVNMFEMGLEESGSTPLQKEPDYPCLDMNPFTGEMDDFSPF